MQRRIASAGSVLVSVALLGACASQVRIPAPAEHLTLDARVYRSDDGARRPAIVLLAPCGGVTTHMDDWARWLNGQGYVALIVDSQSSRGTTTSCEGSRGPGPFQVARDSLNAFVWLRAQPFVDGDHVAVMGWSLGATAALEASSARRSNWPDYANVPSFQAAVAFYPSCYSVDNQPVTPTLLLLAGRDDWTPPARCLETIRSDQGQARRAQAELYPDALHAFDRPDARPYLGHQMAYDHAAAAAAHEAVRIFLGEHLRGSTH